MGQLKIEIQTRFISLFPLLILISSSFALIFLLNYGNSEFLIQYLKSFLHLAFLITFSIVIILTPYKSNTIINVSRSWIILSFFVNLFGIYQLFARLFQLPLAWIDMTNASLNSLVDTTNPYKQLSLQFENFYRATSIFSEPSSLASFNLYIIGMLIFPLFINKEFNLFKNKIVMNSALLISILTLFITFSLTGFVGLIILIFGYLYSTKKLDYGRIFRYGIIAIISIIIADYIVTEFFNISILQLFYDRIAGITGLSDTRIVGESFGTRANNFKYSLETWLKSPLVGVGLGQTKNFGQIGYSDYGVMHSLIETGIIGGLLYVSMIFLLFAKFTIYIKHYEFEDINLKYISYLGFFITLIIIFKNFIVSNMFANWECWLFVGLSISILNILEKNIGSKSIKIDFFSKKKPFHGKEL